MSKRRPSIDRGHSCDPLAGLSEGIEGDSKYDDDADNDLLDVGGDVHEHEAVEQNSDEDRADHRAEDRADAAEQAGAADDHRGDDGELLPGPADPFARVYPSRPHNSTDT